MDYEGRHCWAHRPTQRSHYGHDDTADNKRRYPFATQGIFTEYEGEGAELNEGTSNTLLLESRTQYPQGMQALYSTHFGEAVLARRGQLQDGRDQMRTGRAKRCDEYHLGEASMVSSAGEAVPSSAIYLGTLASTERNEIPLYRWELYETNVASIR